MNRRTLFSTIVGVATLHQQVSEQKRELPLLAEERIEGRVAGYCCHGRHTTPRARLIEAPSTKH